MKINKKVEKQQDIYATERLSRGQSYKTNFGLNYIKNGLIEEKIGKSKL